jgi:hypothetical protein
MDSYPIQLSESILSHAKLDQDSSLLRRELYYIKFTKLESFLSNDQLKSVFWCNIYNAYVLIIAKENLKEGSVFKYKRIKVASIPFSLDDIEFNILGMDKRKSFYKFIFKLFLPSYIKKLSLKEVDYSLQTKLDRTALNRALIHN